MELTRGNRQVEKSDFGVTARFPAFYLENLLFPSKNKFVDFASVSMDGNERPLALADKCT